jgi:Phd_YefM.
MKVINSAELRNNMKKYLDLASNEAIVIQRGQDEMFVLQKKDSLIDFEISDEIPEDFDRAISIDEAKDRVQNGIRKMFEVKRQKQALV